MQNKVLAWAQRQSNAATSHGHILEGMHAQDAGGTPSQTQGLPPSWVNGITSFYDHLHGETPHHCSGTACALARGSNLSGPPGVECLGQCYAAPAQVGVAAPPIPRMLLGGEAVVLRHLLQGPARGEDMVDYSLPPAHTILAAVEKSGLRGRGGAAFLTATKWKTARDTPAPNRYVVANGDEGDPGSFMDRLLLEEAPHSVLAGMVACAQVIGARKGVVFIRGEYPRAAAVMREAIAQARSKGFLGTHFEVEVFCGAGSYVAGEETALLKAIEGLRAEPLPKPPYPAQQGLHGLPTVVQNVETLSVIPWVARHGKGAQAKGLCLSGAVASPGVVEVAMGTPLEEVLQRGGGGPARGTRWKLALVGGPLGRVIPASRFDTPVSYEALPGLGHGGVVVMDDSVSAQALAHHLYDFYMRESCGSCAPCRLGTAQLRHQKSAAALRRLTRTMELGSLCGLGQGVWRPLADLVEHFPKEMFPC